MESYPAPARALVATLSQTAAMAPDRAVAFQGAPGCNSHIAASDVFPDWAPLPCFQFEDALDAVREGRASRALIPIENSLHGRVADIHLLLPESGLSIVGEHFMPIRYALMGFEGGRPVDAMSHPQALGQCRNWLRANHLNPIAYPDTAGAAAAVADMARDDVVAIAPSLAAGLYGLAILAEGIEDSHDNTTRFVIVAREPVPLPPAGPYMTTLVFEVKNVPAALYKALGGFATNGVNMTKLESYQHGASFSATGFYADIEGEPGDPAVARALEELRFHTKWVRVLGSYAQERPRTVA